MRTPSKTKLMSSHPIFSQLSRSRRSALSMLCDEVIIPAGTTLMTEGETGRECFAILDGSVEVTPPNGGPTTVAAGGIVGEMSLLTGDPRSADVIATSPVHALVIDARAFSALTGESVVVRELMATLARRLRQTLGGSPSSSRDGELKAPQPAPTPA